MNIYKDYTTDEVVLNKPCIVDEKSCYLYAAIYPVMLKDLKKLDKYNYLLVFPRDFLENELLKINKEMKEDIFKINFETSYFELVVNYFTLPYKDEKGKIVQRTVEDIIKDYEELFKLVTKSDDVEFNPIMQTFYSKSPRVDIPFNRVNVIREIILMQNVKKELNMKGDPEVRQRINKARQSKYGKSLELGEMIAYVSNYKGENYEYIENNKNIFQFYSDFHCQKQIEDYRSTMNFKMIDSKVPDLRLYDNFIADFYRDDTEDYLITLDQFGQ